MRKLSELPAGHKEWRALARDVLAILSIGEDGYRVYVGAVPGKNHDDEWQLVAEHGVKQDEGIASAMVHHRFYRDPDLPWAR